MATTLLAADDDYIDMEVSSYSSFFCHSSSTLPQPREFEFQMSSIVQEKETTTSPADELFYKGKLLPLHLPPRLQMVEKLLQNSNSPFDKEKDIFEEFYSTPLATTYTTPIAGTPFESCNISPSDSCQVSRELNPEEYYNFDYPTDTSKFSVENQKKSWTKKLKQSSLGSKLRASRAYLKSWFGKSGCSYETYATSTKVADEGSVSKAREVLNKHVQVAKKNSYGQIYRDKYHSSNSVMRSYQEKSSEDGGNHHRRSFSVGIKLLSGNKSSTPPSLSGSTSFSFSNKSYGSQARQLLKRCSSVNSEIENSIQGAIAHCKKSQQMFSSKKTASEVGLYSMSASRTSVCEDHERAELCRG
ncbi:probable membrane-associated kinase regulator 4 [Abrus precatorius]|uniref:Probable membrane-associated kinase regulator 4 n=1 Tax=Abrus precatorius TaxID=3816 RepID=A0A8B8M8H9_ABRPR|nr:probable membrane-associated kinase regulator 4 [Abrus precatorius]